MGLIREKLPICVTPEVEVDHIFKEHSFRPEAKNCCLIVELFQSQDQSEGLSRFSQTYFIILRVSPVVLRGTTQPSAVNTTSSVRFIVRIVCQMMCGEEVRLLAPPRSLTRLSKPPDNTCPECFEQSAQRAYEGRISLRITAKQLQ